MAEGMVNVEGRQSYNDSSYDKCNLLVLTAAMVFTAHTKAEKTAVAVQTRRERSLTSLTY